MGKSVFTLFISIFLSTNLSAQDRSFEINEWSSSGFARFSQVSYELTDGSRKSFQVTISDDPKGKQVVDFRYYHSRLNLCTYRDTDKFSETIMRINGKRVMMIVGCTGGALGVYSLRYFAKTNEGRAHIVTSFMNNEYVPVRMQGFDLKLPAIGFNEAWRDYGGDAI
ncbi:hypothetical protein [Microbulbifer sp. JMSA002]|uniref:hypothetical protein n=1 Tax=Microbulbifer sp. JMSA002 TaxID=3243368 RepID=UPI00403A7A21